MHLVFIYGPPGVGKLTVANALSHLVGFRVFHNHMVLNLLVDLFGYHSPARKRLESQIRQMIIREASKTNVDLIFTTGAVGKPFFSFYDEIIQTVESQGGRVDLVQLTASLESVYQRVESASRAAYGKIATRQMLSKYLRQRPGTFDKFPRRKHLSIDNTEVLPTAAARIIASHYGLPYIRPASNSEGNV